jgi:PAS domain S-box-containing protein
MRWVLPRQRINFLVWTLVAIGLIAGIITNGIVGWTLSEVSSERLKLLEEESRLLQTAQQLRHLAQQEQRVLSDLLRFDLPPVTAIEPLAEYDRLAAELGENLPAGGSAAVHQQLLQTSKNLRLLRLRASDWRQRYHAIIREEREKNVMGDVRNLLQELRTGIEIYEGQQHLQQARQLRQWRHAPPAEGDVLARQILGEYFQPWNRVFNEIKTELVDLSRLVEMLAGENQLDQLADLKDNQIKPTLEHLEYQFAILRKDRNFDQAGSPQALVANLQEKLFGQGYRIVPEYQTIRPGRGGLYQLCFDRLELLREREEVQQEILSAFQNFEVVYPQLFDLARSRSQELAAESEQSLAGSVGNLQFLSIMTLIGFISLGGLISQAARKQIDELTQLRRQNEQILNSAGEGILGFDQGGKVVFANPAGARQLQRSQEWLTGRPYTEALLGAAKEGGVAEAIAGALQSGDYHRSDDQFFLRVAGERFPVVFSVAAMHDERQEIAGAVLVFQDISRRKEAEKRLQEYYLRIVAQEEEVKQLNLDLERKVAERTLLLEAKNRELLEVQEELARAEKLAAIGSLAAGVAHEINTPTAIIRGNVELLKMTLPLDAEGQEEAEEILRQTDRIALITQNMLAFARKQSLNRRSLSLNDLLAEILGQIGHHIPLDQVDISFDPAMNLPDYRGDIDRLRQVFTNLIVNGLQAMDGSGQLRISTRFVDGLHQISIADSGPGIPLNIQEQIFNPFFTTKATGTGLGLSVSYGIVRAHGGSIEVESQSGAGSRFIVVLKGEVQT